MIRIVLLVWGILLLLSLAEDVRLCIRSRRRRKKKEKEPSASTAGGFAPLAALLRLPRPP